MKLLTASYFQLPAAILQVWQWLSIEYARYFSRHSHFYHLLVYNTDPSIFLYSPCSDKRNCNFNAVQACSRLLGRQTLSDVIDCGRANDLWAWRSRGAIPYLCMSATSKTQSAINHGALWPSAAEIRKWSNADYIHRRGSSTGLRDEPWRHHAWLQLLTQSAARPRKQLTPRSQAALTVPPPEIRLFPNFSLRRCSR